jgi:hypothetical protein
MDQVGRTARAIVRAVRRTDGKLDLTTIRRARKLLAEPPGRRSRGHRKEPERFRFQVLKVGD